MEYDSDGSPSNRWHSSPMQHSGWDEEFEDSRIPPRSHHSVESIHDGANSTSLSPHSRWMLCRNMISSVTGFSYALQQKTSSSSTPLQKDDGHTTSCNTEFSPLSKWNTSTKIVSAVRAFAGLNSVSKDSICNDVIYSDVMSSVDMSRSHSVGFVPSKPLYPDLSSLKANGDQDEEHLIQHLSVPSYQNKDVKRRKLDPACSVTDSPIRKLNESSIKKNHRQLKTVSDNCKTLAPVVSDKRKTRSCTRIILLLFIVIGCVVVLLNYNTVFKSDCSLYRDFDFSKLHSVIKTDLYGQHIASQIISVELKKYFSEYFASESATRPLVLSLHGWPGVGKNYVTRLIGKSLPATSVTKFLIALHFVHDTDSKKYSKQVFQWVTSNVTQCKINIFIFDEMDKALEGVISGLNSAITHLSASDEKSAPVIIFLLSNSKGTEITRKVFTEDVIKKRENYMAEDFLDIFLEDKSIWYSDMLSNNLITAVVPFLPLEKAQVTMCIKRDILTKGYEIDDSLVEDVLKEMSFFVVASGKQYSQSGCKRVSEKVDLIYT